MTVTRTVPEIDGLKTRLKKTWMAGDYDRFSRYTEQGARVFYEQLGIPAGCQLLDIACGSGQVALWAARDGVRYRRGHRREPDTTRIGSCQGGRPQGSFHRR